MSTLAHAFPFVYSVTDPKHDDITQQNAALFHDPHLYAEVKQSPEHRMFRHGGRMECWAAAHLFYVLYQVNPHQTPYKPVARAVAALDRLLPLLPHFKPLSSAAQARLFQLDATTLKPALVADWLVVTRMFCVSGDRAAYWCEAALLQITGVARGTSSGAFWGEAFMEHLAILLYNRYDLYNQEIQDVLLDRLREAAQPVNFQRVASAMNVIVDICSTSEKDRSWTAKQWNDVSAACRVIRGDTCSSTHLEIIAQTMDQVVTALESAVPRPAQRKRNTVRPCAAQASRLHTPDTNSSHLYNPDDE